MANYLAERLSIGFSNAGFEPSIITVPKGYSSKLVPIGKERNADGVKFVVDMRDWRYDLGGFRPSFKYDISVAVYSPGGSIYANEDFDGTELMPTGGFKHYTERYAEVYQNVFDKVFASQPIAEALKKDEAKKVEPKKAEAKPPAPTPPKKPPQPVPKFDPKQVAALLDKRVPQHVAATGDTLNGSLALGVPTGADD